MKNCFRVLLGILSFSFLSCSSSNSDDPSESLKMDIGSSAAILIPAPATTLSCEQIAKGETTTGALSGSYFTLPKPTISWTKVDDVSDIRIVVLKLTLKSPKLGGEYTCVFSDLALGALFFKRSSVGENIVVSIWDARLGARSPSGVVSTRDMIANSTFDPCDIKCGGVTVPPNSGQFSVTGQWELLAVQKKYLSATSTEAEEFPIKVTGSFTVDNVLN